jgi:hypothetical protein
MLLYKLCISVVYASCVVVYCPEIGLQLKSVNVWKDKQKNEGKFIRDRQGVLAWNVRNNKKFAWLIFAAPD